MMNLTRNDWQFDQGGCRRWRFRYRLVLVSGESDPLQPFREVQQFGVPPYLQVPGAAPVLPDLDRLEIDFDGGPVISFKVAADGQRLVLRLWNVLDRPVAGSVRLPAGFGSAERCDALERAQDELPVARGRAAFTARPRGILTIALRRK
jgi:alpha-mannosidase